MLPLKVFRNSGAGWSIFGQDEENEKGQVICCKQTESSEKICNNKIKNQAHEKKVLKKVPSECACGRRQSQNSESCPLGKSPSVSSKMLTKRSCEMEEDEDGLCCTAITCGTEFCITDVLCIAIGFMLMLMIIMQAYKIICCDEPRPCRR